MDQKHEVNRQVDEGRYYIIRADRAGVFFGHIKERRGDEVDMAECRRLW